MMPTHPQLGHMCVGFYFLGGLMTMKRWMAVGVLATVPCWAMAQQPSEASVLRLIEASRMSKMMSDQAMSSLRGVTDQLISKNVTMTDAQRVKFKEYTERVAAIQKEVMSFDRMKPMFVKLYQDTFTQDEVDGMTAFYESPPGKALVEKTPKLMQNMAPMMGQLMQDMMPRLQAESVKFAQEIKELQQADKK